METLDAIKTRRTIGLSEGEVPHETIVELIEAATWAPNHRLTQPWRYTVITGSAREALGRVWGDCAAKAAAPENRDAIRAGEGKKPLRAPVVIALSVRTDPDPMMAEEDFAATAAGAQNLLLAAHAKGLAAGWKSGKICWSEEVKRFLGLEPTDKIIGMVYVGMTATEVPKLKPRNVEAAIRWISEAVPA